MTPSQAKALAQEVLEDERDAILEEVDHLMHKRDVLQLDIGDPLEAVRAIVESRG
jgi:hypothetical protein